MMKSLDPAPVRRAESAQIFRRRPTQNIAPIGRQPMQWVAIGLPRHGADQHLQKHPQMVEALASR
jgi:hypothetical protein